VSELTEGLGHIEADIKKFEHIDSKNKQQQWNKKSWCCLLSSLCACYEEMWSRRGEDCRLVCLISSNHLHGLVRHHRNCWML